MVRDARRHRDSIQGVKKTASGGQTVHAVGPPFRSEFLLSYVRCPKHLLTCLTAQRRFANEQGCKTADHASRHVASAQWRSDENDTSNLRPVSKEQFLAKILPRFWRERHFIRRPPEDFHPKFISAVGKKQPTDAAAHAVPDHHNRFEFRKLLLYSIEFF